MVLESAFFPPGVIEVRAWKISRRDLSTFLERVGNHRLMKKRLSDVMRTVYLCIIVCGVSNLGGRIYFFADVVDLGFRSLLKLEA